ncbi:MAG: Carboxylesterase NlhH [Pseudomonadales bacterium]|nr:Carboxylesterase NlhH [Pseudomonadales bacterium]
MPLHPQVLPLIEMLNQSMAGLPANDVMEIATVREVSLAPPPANPTPVARVEDRRLPGPAGEIPVRIYTPGGTGPLPLLMFFHGGGFVLCSLETHDELCRGLCRDSGALVVSVDYRLAPEAKYPAAADDCYAATLWCARNAQALGADPRRIAVAGDSAGGNLAAVTALRARDLGAPALCHQLLIYPVIHCDFDTPSYRENAQGYFLTAEAMRWFWSHYLAHPGQASEPYACPSHASDLAGLPPATVITAGYDPLRDEAEDYAARLRAAGVSVRLQRYAGMIHGFVSMADVFDDGRAARELIAEQLRDAFA